MAGFVAKRAVQRIAWDFRLTDKIDPETGKVVGKFTNSDAIAVGELTEPSDEQVNKLTAGLRDVAKEFDIKSLQEIPDDLMTKAREMQTELFVETLGLERELLDQLPPRMFNAFRDYLAGELNPEGGSAA